MGRKRMANYGFTGRTISKKLKTETIQNGGLETVTMPIVHCKLASELEEITVPVGGYDSFINYNKHREGQFKQDHQNKSLRDIKRKIRSNELRNRGLTYPTTSYSSSVILAYVCRSDTND